jgi:hypothetical protein
VVYENVLVARAAAGKAHSDWWALYMKDPKGAETLAADTLSKSIRADVLTQFGKPDPAHPECSECLSTSVFEGPSHEASSNCQSGRRPHCTCDTCF